MSAPIIPGAEPESIDGGPFVVLTLEMLTRHGQVCECLFWFDHPAVRLADIKMNECGIVITPPLPD